MKVTGKTIQLCAGHRMYFEKSFCKKVGMEEGDTFSIFVEDGGNTLIFKKISLTGTLDRLRAALENFEDDYEEEIEESNGFETIQQLKLFLNDLQSW